MHSLLILHSRPFADFTFSVFFIAIFSFSFTLPFLLFIVSLDSSSSLICYCVPLSFPRFYVLCSFFSLLFFHSLTFLLFLSPLIFLHHLLMPDRWQYILSAYSMPSSFQHLASQGPRDVLSNGFITSFTRILPLIHLPSRAMPPPLSLSLLLPLLLFLRPAVRWAIFCPRCWRRGVGGARPICVN